MTTISPITLSVLVVAEPITLDIGIDFDVSIVVDVNVQVVPVTDYESLSNKPQINGVELAGNKSSEDLGLISVPEGGNNGDVLMLDGGMAAWKTPASSAEQDNTRPITAAAVYTEIGNINSLLATI